VSEKNGKENNADYTFLTGFSAFGIGHFSTHSYGKGELFFVPWSESGMNLNQKRWNR